MLIAVVETIQKSNKEIVKEEKDKIKKEKKKCYNTCQKRIKWWDSHGKVYVYSEIMNKRAKSAGNFQPLDFNS